MCPEDDPQALGHLGAGARQDPGEVEQVGQTHDVAPRAADA